MTPDSLSNGQGQYVTDMLALIKSVKKSLDIQLQYVEVPNVGSPTASHERVPGTLRALSVRLVLNSLTPKYGLIARAARVSKIFADRRCGIRP